MKRHAILTALLLATGGCVKPVDIVTADGKAGLAIDCSGEARTWKHCYKAAGDACGARGYTILTQNNEHRPSLVRDGPSDIGSALGGSTVSRSMIVQCKP